MATSKTNGDIVLTVDSGDKFSVPASLACITTYVLLEQGCWFEKELAFVRRFLEPGMRAIDIGANLGMYAIPMAKAILPNGTLNAFEPGSAARTSLIESIKLNQLDNISVSAAAVGARVGTAFLQIGTSSELNAISFSENVSGAVESVAVTTLDVEFACDKSEAIHFIKIDAEGLEGDILQGAIALLSQQSPLIMAEIKHGQSLNTQLLERFVSLGYQTFKLTGDGAFLVPFAAGDPVDGFDLNIFAAKADTMALLEQRGLLAQTGATPLLTEAEVNLAIDRFLAQPFAQQLEISIADVRQCPFASGLIAYSAYRYLTTLGSNRRYALIRAAEDCLHGYCERIACSAARSTWACIASDLGLRSLACDILLSIASHPDAELAQPFFPAMKRFEKMRDISDSANWFLAAVEESLELQSSYSSLFGRDVERMARLATRGYDSETMYRRRVLSDRALLNDLDGERCAFASTVDASAASHSEWLNAVLALKESFTAPTTEESRSKTGKKHGNIGPPSSIAHLLEDDLIIVVADIGASLIDSERPPYQPLIDSGKARLIAFEPDPVALAELRRHYPAPNECLPHFVGDGAKHTFYETNWGATGSLFAPNTPLLEKFHNLAELVTLVDTSTVSTVRLDDMPQCSDIDFIKIDAQGAELMIFENAKRVLSGVTLVQTEINYVELYKDMPLFCDIDRTLRSHGFQLHTTLGPGMRPFRPILNSSGFQKAFRQHLWADVIYVKDWMQFDSLPPAKLIKLAVLLHDLYRSCDLAHAALAAADRQSDTCLAQQYFDAMVE